MPKILIVEDEQVSAEKCEERLLRENFEVETARSAEQGMELLRRTNPDLVLLDILLPKGNGFLFLERMKKTGLASTPVIAFSDYEDPEIEHRAKDRGVNYCVVRRNYTFNRIIDKVKEVLNKTI